MALFLILAIVMYLGKGDKLIAGYNTASEKEREEVDIVRLRKVMGTSMVAMALTSLVIDESLSSMLLFWPLSMAVCIVTVVLANTWARKK